MPKRTAVGRLAGARSNAGKHSGTNEERGFPLFLLGRAVYQRTHRLDKVAIVLREHLLRSSSGYLELGDLGVGVIADRAEERRWKTLAPLQTSRWSAFTS